MKIKLILTAALGSMALVSCSPKPETASAPAAATQSGAVREVLAARVTGEPQAIHKARAAVKPGDEITLRGRIMGNIKPFVEGRAAFILGDTETLKACSDTPGDGCETPWDNCCDTPAAKKAGTATVQIVDASGRVLKENIEGVGGLEKLAHVTVSGKVAQGSSAELLVVNATAISTAK